MAFNEALADDIRTRLRDRPGLSERKMFGGIAFMINGNMAVGVSGDELMVRVGADAQEEAIGRPGARPSYMGDRPMKGWVMVAQSGMETDTDFDGWLSQGVALAESLPPK